MSEDNFPKSTSNKVTIVTAMWNIGRSELPSDFKRSYQTYLDKFSEFLKAPVNMYIYVDKSDEEFVWSRRSRDNTVVKLMSVDELAEWFPFTEKTNEIRQKPEWLNQAGWLPDSTQAKLKMYNPLVMSKMFMLNNCTIWNQFDSDYLFWVDGGITNTVHWGYFTHDKVHEKLPNLTNKFMFVTFPYIGGNEIHGFPRTAMNEIASVDEVEYVCRGGVFGGHKKSISEVNGLYYGLLQNSLHSNYMGTEESIFTLMSYIKPELFDLYTIQDNGLLGTFFEDVKNNTTKGTPRLISSKYQPKPNPKVALYVIGFNSPDQFEVLIESYLKHDHFITDTKNFLIDNSTDPSTYTKYKQLCEKYNFEHIKKDNLGICGGRQFIAEHFEELLGYDYYIFLEDDMNLMPENSEICTSGFKRYTSNMFNKCLNIINMNGYDFLKFSFSEFFGTNSVQWSWYNVPQHIREEFFPEKTKLPVSGTDPNAPLTRFNNIRVFDQLPYVDGEIYYCNWPQLVSREGNTKMFLKTKWAHPYEQTWMSYIFQETKKKNIRGALLLLSPINHHRFHHYDGKLRKES